MILDAVDSQVFKPAEGNGIVIVMQRDKMQHLY